MTEASATMAISKGGTATMDIGGAGSTLMAISRGPVATMIISKGGSSVLDFADFAATHGMTALWPLNETSGTAADEVVNGATWDGLHTGVALAHIAGPGNISDYSFAYYDGSTGLTGIDTAAIRAAWDWTAGGALIIVKPDGAFWTDGMKHRFVTYRANGNNQIFMEKTFGSNTLRWRAKVGGVNAEYQAAYSDVDWFDVGITWGDGATSFYKDGLPLATGGLGVGVGTLDRVAIGSDNDAAPSSPMLGWLGVCCLWLGTTPSDATMLAVRNTLMGT